jgi:hypothetical protein
VYKELSKLVMLHFAICLYLSPPEGLIHLSSLQQNQQQLGNASILIPVSELHEFYLPPTPCNQIIRSHQLGGFYQLRISMGGISDKMSGSGSILEIAKFQWMVPVNSIKIKVQ